MIDWVSPNLPQQSNRLRNNRNPVQPTVLVACVVVSLHKSVIFAQIVSLTSLIGSTVAFATAFCLETLVFSRQMWAKVSVGVVFAIVILLISWCVWTMIGAMADFSVFGTFYGLKDRLVNFTMGLRGEAVEAQPDAGHREGDDETRSRILEGIFSFTRRWRGSTFSTQVVGDDQIVGNV